MFFSRRLPPNKKLTMHQKALFCFWVSIIALLITLQIIKLIRKIRTYTAGRSCDDDQIEIATDQGIDKLETPIALQGNLHCRKDAVAKRMSSGALTLAHTQPT